MARPGEENEEIGECENMNRKKDFFLITFLFNIVLQCVIIYFCFRPVTVFSGKFLCEVEVYFCKDKNEMQRTEFEKIIFQSLFWDMPAIYNAV